ncbi:hypothetical protein H9Q10_04660 [Eikenella sp. S3360]|uniref:Uncharacterized protein n=1 Tax=Eikenella glucosivorans TaxID=2766967 RepID=A0ABS0N9H6_9NEIS|nr:hypothetical protein [Eikenella glucosivorans]MBH5328958.1 hypothetical protein [Eikenella glucosivorans]
MGDIFQVAASTTPRLPEIARAFRPSPYPAESFYRIKGNMQAADLNHEKAAAECSWQEFGLIHSALVEILAK